MTLEDKVREYVKGIYYTDVEEKELWEPFENYSSENIKEFIENDTEYWMTLINHILLEERKYGG